MAEISRTFRWQRFVPDLGDNRDLPKPFYLEVAVGITREQLDQLLAAGKELHEKAYVDGPAGVVAAVDDLAKMLSPFIRMGKEPLVVDGKTVASLRDYLELCASMPNLVNALELPMAVRFCNQLGGDQELFFERLSGGFSSTPAPNGARAGSQGAAR